MEGRWFSFSGLVKPLQSRKWLCVTSEGLVWIRCPQGGWKWVGSFSKLIWFCYKLGFFPPSLLDKKGNISSAMSGFSIYDFMWLKMWETKQQSDGEDEMWGKYHIKLRRQSGKHKAANNSSSEKTITVTSLFHESKAKQTWFPTKFCPTSLNIFSSILNSLSSSTIPSCSHIYLFS